MQLKITTRLHFTLLILWIVAFTINSFGEESYPILSKSEALKSLKESAFKWKQAEGIKDEAQALKQQAEAALKPHSALIARDMAMKSNFLKYGIDTNSASSDIVNFAVLGAEFDYGLFDEKSHKRLNAAEANVKAQDANSKNYQTELSFYTLLAYLNAQKFSKKIEVQKEIQKINQEILQMANSKLSSGAGIPLDVMRAKGLVSLGQLKEVDAQSNFDKARNDLASLLGRDNNHFLVEALNYSPISEDVIKKTKSEGEIEKRFDIQAAVATSEAAKKLVEEAHSEYKPRISIFGDAGVGTSSSASTTSSTAPVGTVGIQLIMPIYSGGYFDAKIQESSVKSQRAELQAKQLKIEASSGIENAKTQLITAQKAYELSLTQIEISSEELKLAKKRFQTGAVGGFETASAQNNYSAALESNIDAMFAHEAAKLNYLKQIGKILEFNEFK